MDWDDKPLSLPAMSQRSSRTMWSENEQKVQQVLVPYNLSVVSVN